MPCSEEGCNRRASHGLPGLPPDKCNPHKGPMYINRIMKKCRESTCYNIARYSLQGPAIFCKIHKEDGSNTNASRKLCNHPGCTDRADVGPPGSPPTSCCEHRGENFSNIYSECIQDGCSVGAVYGPVGGRPKYCISHKDEIHVNVSSKMCQHPECPSRANFGPVGGSAEYCKPHKNKEHINIYAYPCQIEGCDRCPIYGIPGKKHTHCASHKLEGHVSSAIRCAETDCNLTAKFAPEGHRPVYCSGHKGDGDIDVVHMRCTSDGCSLFDYGEISYASRVDPTTGRCSLCVGCWRSLYGELDHHLKVRKEHFVLAEVQRQIPELEGYFLVWDCKIPGQVCSNSKPDMAWMINDTLFQIEIDEEGLAHEDDDTRLVGIHAASGAKNHICIRFNPDKYGDNPSCFQNRNLVNGSRVFNRHPTEWDRRMDILISNIKDVFEKCVCGKGESVCGKRKICFE